MRRILPTTAVVLALLASGAAALADEKDSREAARNAPAQLQGTWNAVTMEREGEAVPKEDIAGRSCVYDHDEFTLRANGQARRRGIVTLDPSRPIKAINTWDLNGPYTDATV